MHECKHEGDISTMVTEIENLKKWENTQNKSIKRLEDKIDDLKTYMMKTAVGIVVALLLHALLLNGGA